MTERIKLGMTPLDAIAAVSEGNPGALRVCCELAKDGGMIDPDSALGGFGNVLSLDTHGIWGSKIWMLYKDVCGESVSDMVAILRAVQLGFFSESALRLAIDGDGEVDVEGLRDRVEKELPRFQKSNGDS